MTDQDMIALLVREATQARQRAYAPYSQFPVGAALRTQSGRIYAGCNVENASYGLSVCAERIAIWQAVMAQDLEFASIAVVTDIGASPCGACRQVMAEFAPEMTVIIADLAGGYRITTVSELLPDAFLPGSLQQSPPP